MRDRCWPIEVESGDQGEVWVWGFGDGVCLAASEAAYLGKLLLSAASRARARRRWYRRVLRWGIGGVMHVGGSLRFRKKSLASPDGVPSSSALPASESEPSAPWRRP